MRPISTVVAAPSREGLPSFLPSFLHSHCLSSDKSTSGKTPAIIWKRFVRRRRRSITEGTRKPQNKTKKRDNSKGKMAFTGTLDKCKVCDKTVHVVDMMSMEGVPYHKTCFRCNHCNGTLVMSTYSSMDGVLYCRTHFDQLFKESGNFSKNFAKSSDRQQELNRTPSKVSAMFSGTLDKCAACEKTVYPLEKVTMEGECYHKTCFKCAHGGCPLTHSSYAALDGVLYCKHHFARLFMEKGDYKHVLSSATHRRNNSSSPNTPPPDPVEPKPESEDQPEE